MAGAGYKLFNTGDVLTAAQVNTYLMEQTVMVFADAAARTSALSGVLAEGMLSYLKDTNATEVYDGSAWVGIGSSGDITGVTAGTGISGGGTTGTVTITNDMATTITASGDIIVGTGSGTYDNLPIGTTGQVLTADTSVSPYKVKWASVAAGGGKILQVVEGTYTTETSNSTSTLTDTGLTATITPSSASSKILVFANILGIKKSNGNAANQLHLALLRGATTIRSVLGLYTNSTLELTAPSAQLVALDSPATTSATTYKVQFANYNNTASVTVQNVSSFVEAKSTIILMEVGA